MLCAETPIFRIATGVPDPLVCFEQDYQGSRRDTSGQSYKRYKESLVTKRTICLVSRVWNLVATPQLYERLVIASAEGDHSPRRRQIRRLIRALGSPSPQSSSPESSLGTFVRRLDFTFPEGRDGTEFSRQKITRVIVELVGMMPNLQTTSTLPDFKVPILHFQAFLDGHPSLDTVQIVYDFEDPKPGQESASLWKGKAYPSIRHWVLRLYQVNALAVVPTTVFPKLEMVTYPYYPHASDHLARFTNFVSIHGSRLKTIRMSPHKQLKDMLEVVARWCPRLTEVHLVYKRRWVTPSTIAMASVVVSMPRITTLGLSLYNYDEKKHSADWERAIMLKWKDLFPSLHTIRLLEEKDVELLRQLGEEKLGQIVGHCCDSGVSLQDDHCSLFTIDGR
ncbi:hypothetical protein FA13DRAFT_1737603 [Coprinellus micaceus]|uniref:F-box domain-containing protein n=1 Tax=Coprinellus micaceus TaxID=71717 RepID=A0A4Y7SWW6_COPMI|nr:hypothetical protein FA13DRAFT_1737603 [Coprinellus micaceus]